MSGNIHNAGQFFGAFAVGAIAGLTGAWYGAVTSATVASQVGIGAINGAMAGATGGAAGGLIGGAGNAWLSGASFGDGLIAGFNGAGMGALTGGVIGGITGGINSAIHHGNFFDGDGFTSEFSTNELKSLAVQKGDNIPVEFSNESLNENGRLFNPEGVGCQYADGTLPPNYENSGNAFVRQQSWIDKFVNGNAKPAVAVTRFNFKTQLSDVYFSKAAFSSRLNLFLSMQHEYVHCSINLHYSNPDFTANERAAYDITNRQLTQWGYKSIWSQVDVDFPKGLYTPTYQVNINRTIRIVRPW